jgi:D-arabinose 1-dehydrogenase-like Zn-dependent alcohol dehydrogenase
LAKKLGAAEYIDSMATKPADGLQKLGGARVILATAPNAKAMSQLVGGLGVGGRLLVVGAPFEPLEISALQLIGPRRGIQGWPSGSAMDSEDTLRFCAQSGVRPMIERYPLTKVKEWC